MNDSHDKFFCPRLIDYIAIVGSFSPLAKNESELSAVSSQSSDKVRSTDNITQGGITKSVSNFTVDDKPSLTRSSTLIGSISSSNTSSISHIQNPDLLRRYPLDDHNDFPLPKDIVCFCQPEGCITTTGKLSDYNKVSSFVFTISDKDTVRTRYGVCVNFYRPVRPKLKHLRSRNVVDYADCSTTSDTSPEKFDHAENNKQDSYPEAGNDGDDNYDEKTGEDNKKLSAVSWTSVKSRNAGVLRHHYRPRQKTQYNTLTSICLISHHPFFMAFRECLFYLKSLVDICNDSIVKVQDYHCKRTNLWDIVIHQLQIDNSTVRHFVREIERWILRLLSAPVPVPGKTRVEIELYASKDTCNPLVFALPDHTRFSLVDFPLHLPLELLGVETCMQVLTLILLERKVVLQSRDYNALSMSVMAFISLVYPLEYMFPVIPLLPISLDHSECLLDNPTPYVVGIPVNFFSLKRQFSLPDDIWLVDLDTNKVIPPSNGYAIAMLPEPDGTVLKNHLRQAVSRLSAPLTPSSNSLMADATNDVGGFRLFNQQLSNESSMDDDQQQKFTKDRMMEYGGAAAQQYASGSNEVVVNDNINDDVGNAATYSGCTRLKSEPMPMANPYDADAVDVAVRVAMVKFFNSRNMLANLTEHTRTIRLFPRPVVTVQTKSFIQSRTEVTRYIEDFSKTQAVEYFAESSLMPSNVVFQRIQMDVTDPSLIGDKGKWFAHTLEPVVFSVWNKSGFLDSVFKEYNKKPDAETDQSGADTDVEDNSLSPVSSDDHRDIGTEQQLEEDRADNESKNGPSPPTMYYAEDTIDVVYDPPCNLQIPCSADRDQSPLMSSSTTSASTESDLNSPEFQPSSLVNPDIIDVIIPQQQNSKMYNATATLENKKNKSFKSLRKRDDSFWTSFRRKSSQDDEDSDDDDEDLDVDEEQSEESCDTISSNRQLSRRKPTHQEGSLFAQMDKITVQARKAAGEASKSMQEVSKTAFEASKTAAGVSKSTFEDLTYVGKNTFGDVTKSAKQFASKTKFLKVGLLSELASSGRANDDKSGSSNTNVNLRIATKMLAERSPLIRHSSPKRSDSHRSVRSTSSSFSDKSMAANSAENQNFLRDIAHQVLEGDSIGWLKINRCRKLLEDESNRCLLLSKLNKTLDDRVNPSDYIEDVYISRVMWKSMLKILQAAIHGLEISFANSSTGGMASVFHVLEIAHTHYWSKSGNSSVASGAESRISSPFGSHEDIQSPASPQRSAAESRKTSDISTASTTDGSSTIARTNSSSSGGGSGVARRLQKSLTKEGAAGLGISEVLDVSNISTAADILRDLFNKRKESASCLTTATRSPSVDTECTADVSLRMSPESSNISEAGSMVTNPSYVLQRMHKNNSSFRSTVSDSEIDHTFANKPEKPHVPSAWSSKSSLSASFRYNSAAIHNTLGFNNSESGGRTYLFEGLIGKERSSLWDKMEFWEDAFIDAVSHERDVVGLDQGPEELMDRYKHLSEDEQRRLAHDEDRLLSTMLHNLIAFMVMIKVKKQLISSKVRSMLGKCRIAICYAEEIITLLSQLNTLDKNNVDLKCVASRLGHGQSFAVHVGTDSSGILLFVEVRDDGLVMRTINGIVYERWWYERVINMTYSPKNKVLCLWKKVGGQTSLHKYYTKKSKQLYYCIKTAMERAVAHGQNIGHIVELGGEFPVKDLSTGEGGLLQVCMEGIGLLFCGSKFFVKLRRIRKCFTVKGRYFIFEEFNPKTRVIIPRKYESSLAAQICYSVLCVFSYAAAVQHHKCTPQALTPDAKQTVDLARLP